MIERIAVVVPAADEQDTVGACLSALEAAAREVDCAVRIIVVLDACTDATPEVVATFENVEVIRSDGRNVGGTRRTGVAHAISTDADPAQLLIASTDADSTVPAQWFVRLRALAASAELVIGTVLPDRGLRGEIEGAWFAAHDLRDGHPHVHAANLAIRAEAYLRIGGWRPLATGEDEDLVSRAATAGLSIVRTAGIPVLTSTRAIGRAPLGFSSYLRALGHA